MTAAPTDEAAPKRGGMPRNRQFAILGIAAMIALGLFFGVPALIHLFTPKPPPPPAAPPPGTFRAAPQQWSTLEFATVQPVSFRMADVTDGKIALDDNLTTQVFSPYTGRVVRVIAKVGDHVSKGSPLFSVDAAEFVQAQSDLLTAAAQVRLTEAAAARQKALFAAEGAAQRDVEQSESDLATAKAALSAARNRLRVLGESAAEVSAVERGLARSGGIEPEVVVPSPIAGIVTQRSIGVGQNLGNISSNAPPAPAFTVSDLSTVWLVGNLREVDAPRATLCFIGRGPRGRPSMRPARNTAAVIDDFQNVADALQADTRALQAPAEGERSASHSLTISAPSFRSARSIPSPCSPRNRSTSKLSPPVCRPRARVMPTRSPCSRRWAAAGGIARTSERPAFAVASFAIGAIFAALFQQLKGGGPVSHCLQPRSQTTWSLKNEVPA